MRTGRQAGRGGVSGAVGAPAAGPARRGLRLLGLFVVVVVVVVGAGVGAPRDDPPTSSRSQQAQVDAEDRYLSLARTARAVAAAEPGLAELLAAVAHDLDAQAAAVALPRPPSHAGGPTAAPSPVTASGDRPPTGTSAELLGLLRGSALVSLSDALSADPGPARVLAAAGARQWQRARELGTALDLDPGLPLPDASTASALEAGTGPFTAFPGPAGAVPSPPYPGGGQGPHPAPACSGTPQGPETDRQALRRVRTAEEQARYGYEVAAALLQDSALLARAAEHAAAADTAGVYLRSRCEDPEPVPAGFVLSPAFRKDPAAELRRLEQQHLALYANSVAAVGPGVRAWAVVALVAATLREPGAGTAPDPLPGLDDTATGAAGPPPAGGDEDRAGTEDRTDG